MGGLGYKLGFVFHVQSQIAVEALKRMREILPRALPLLFITSAWMHAAMPLVIHTIKLLLKRRAIRAEREHSFHVHLPSS